MNDCKRTVLYDAHVAAGASMVDFGGWEMPMQYKSGIVEEHLFTRQNVSLFDVSHMGRFLIEGPERVAFLQHVLSSNVLALGVNQAQYTILPTPTGGAVDDAYLYRFAEDSFILVVNAANTDKDKAHLLNEIKAFNATLTDKTQDIALIAVQGPKCKELLSSLCSDPLLTEPVKNALNTVLLDGCRVGIAKTGYTGEPLGYELFTDAKDAPALWEKLLSLGARPAGLGARDTLRLEAALPLYGHEMGTDAAGREIPIYAVPVVRFAVSFSEAKGDFIGRDALMAEYAAYQRIMNRRYADTAALPRRIRAIALTGRGVMRAGQPVYCDGKEAGYITSGTMVPYLVTEGSGLSTVMTDTRAMRSIGLAYVDNNVLEHFDVEVDIRGKRVPGVIVASHMSSMAPPYARPLLVNASTATVAEDGAYETRAEKLLDRALQNHVWRQTACVNLIPSEMTPSRAVRLLSASDPAFRYAEHRRIRAFNDSDIFYYQGTKFIGEVEQLLVKEMKTYLGCTEVETRLLSGQMSNVCAFSALMNYKNRLNRKRDPQRLGYVLNNHIIKGGHLSAQPMGALHDYIAVDPVTERPAVVNFPVCRDNLYKIDVAATKEILDKYRPELIIFGKSMVLHREPVAEIRKFVDEMGLSTTIMYDMAHVLGLIGDHFQKPFAEGAEIVTGSTHKTFFGTQRGVLGVNYRPEQAKYGIWSAVASRAFPGSVSNHHLGTQLGLLMAAYEMNTFKDAYQAAVIHNAKHFSAALHDAGLTVAGDPAISYTETHQAIVHVGYGKGAAIAERLEQNNIIVNYQATPDEEGFSASGALRMGVSEMTRFGADDAFFDRLAQLMADCILRNIDVKDAVTKLRSDYLDMRYCFTEDSFNDKLDALLGKLGM